MALRSRRHLPPPTEGPPRVLRDSKSLRYRDLPVGTILTKTTTYPKARIDSLVQAVEASHQLNAAWQQRSWITPDACPACGLSFSAGEKVVREEIWGGTAWAGGSGGPPVTPRERYRWWHYMCHPTVVDRYIARARKKWAAKGIT